MSTYPRQFWRALRGVLLPGLMLARVLAAEPSTSSDPPRLKGPGDLESSIERGVGFLIERQNKDGSWGTAQKTKDLNIYAPVPGSHHAFRCGVTALCVESLIDTGAYKTNAKARTALEKSEGWLLENLPKLRRAESVAIYNVWGHAYGIEAFAAMHEREGQKEELKPRIKEAIKGQIDLLRRYESVDGGWGYYDFRVGSQRPATDSTSFVSATALVAFHDARQIGVEIPADILKRAVDSIQRQRKPDNSYMYGEYLKMRPMLGINRPAGSLGRSQACNLALRHWGDKTITDKVLIEWLDRLFSRNDWLGMGRKRPIPHESWFQVAGYFYYYGHYYAALCMAELEPAQSKKYREQMAALITQLQEKDGSWWDFPLYDYHQPYGTAFALMTLARCREIATNAK